MSGQTSSTDELPAGAPDRAPVQPYTARRASRIVGLAVVCLGVAALAAAAFVLSYSAIRTVALQAGITPRLARGYPLVLDAMLLIVLAAILALRSARVPSRLLAWVTLVLVVAAAAGADALHAAGRSLPHQEAAITAAVLPWLLVILAFALLLAMLRHSRLRRAAGAAGGRTVRQAQPTRPVPAQAADSTDRADSTGRADSTDQADSTDGAGTDETASTESANHNPATDDGTDEPASGATPFPADPPLAEDYVGPDSDWAASAPATADGEDAQAWEQADGSDDPDMPVFHRFFSTPTPPAEAEA